MTSTARLVRAGTGALVVLLLLLGGARLAVGRYVVSGVDPGVDRATAAGTSNAELLRALGAAQSALRGYQLTGEPSMLASYRAGLTAYATARSAIRSAADAADTGSLRSLVAAETADADAWVSYSAPLAAATGVPARESADAATRGEELFDRLRVSNTRVAAGFDADRLSLVGRARTARLVSDALTALFAIVAAVLLLVVGRRTRQLDGPFDEMRAVLVRLGGGDRTARATPGGPPQARAAAEALNALADDCERLRSSESDRARTRQQAHDLGAAVRSSLEPDTILGEVVGGLGVVLDVDHVYLRLADGRSAPAAPADKLWSRSGSAAPPIETFRAATSTAPWPGGSVLAVHPTGERSAAADVLSAAAPTGGACLATGFTVDAESSGLLVLVRTGPGRAWTDDERVLVEAVAADAGRGLHVARVYGHQRELAERFQDLDRQKTDFISTVSHELRTPLTSILGYLEILLSGEAGELTDVQERSLKVVERNAERLRELVGDLLTLSRIGSGNLEMTATRVEVATLVDGVRDAFDRPAAAAGLTLRCDDGCDLAVIGDSRQLERVLLNVVGNAVKFTPAGGTVQVAVRSERAQHDAPAGRGECVVIEVVDDGMGIPVGEQDKLFQPFQRASNAVDSAIQGTGLGLAIARSILERHGGDVTLRSVLGQGTTLTLTLPRALGGAPEAATATNPREAAIRAAKARALARSAAR